MTIRHARARTHTRLLLAGLVSCASILAACGSDKASDSEPAPSSMPSDATQPGATAEPVESEAVESEPVEAEPAADTAIDPGNSCTVDVTGAVNDTWVNTGGLSTFGYGPFIEGGAYGDDFFVLGCYGEGNNSITFSAAPGSTIPAAPAEYIVPKADNVFGSSDRNLPISVITGFEGTTTNFGPKEDGILRITQFDRNVIAGSFDVQLTDVLALNPALSLPSQGDIRVVGTFRYTLG